MGQSRQEDDAIEVEWKSIKSVEALEYENTAHSRVEAAEMPSSPGWPLVPVTNYACEIEGSDRSREHGCTRLESRRNRVYDDIMRKWKQAVPGPTLPRPRSSHPRVLGGQALSTRQVGGKVPNGYDPVGSCVHDGPTRFSVAQFAGNQYLLSSIAGIHPQPSLSRQHDSPRHKTLCVCGQPNCP